jgi:hypothetical protein
MFTKIDYKFHKTGCSQTVLHLGLYTVIHDFHIYYMIWVKFSVMNLHTTLLSILSSMKIRAKKAMGINEITFTCVQ